MAEKNKENLKELFEEFFEAEQASEAAEDIRLGEKILEENSAPEPSGEVKEQIKRRIFETLEKRKIRAYRRLLYKPAAVAAIIVFVFAVSIKLFEIKLFERPQQQMQVASLIPASVWEGNDIIKDDIELAVLSAEIEQVGDDILTVQLDQSYGNGRDAVIELELELIEIDSDFWKG